MHEYEIDKTFRADQAAKVAEIKRGYLVVREHDPKLGRMAALSGASTARKAKQGKLRALPTVKGHNAFGVPS